MNVRGFVTLDVLDAERGHGVLPSRRRVLLSPLDIAAVWEEPTGSTVASQPLFETCVQSSTAGVLRVVGCDGVVLGYKGEGQRLVGELIDRAMREREALATPPAIDALKKIAEHKPEHHSGGDRDDWMQAHGDAVDIADAALDRIGAPR